MHEFSLLSNLLKKLNRVVEEEGASRATEVTVKLGALSHISPEHFREHFVHATRGTVAENAVLKVVASDNETDPHAQEILLESVEVE